ncbi:MAG: stage II sporulation protein P [Clostridia bacterium]|nr:stage II sporulation protein P [Clostridia bacterium]
MLLKKVAAKPAEEKKEEETPPIPESTKKEHISSRSPARTSADTVKINNSTTQTINASDYNSIPAFLKGDISVLIVHTHTTESYTPSQTYFYTPSDTDRTLDKNYNMVRVGNEIKNVLSQNGIKVYHDTTINDYPSYNGSYNKSAVTIANYIKNDPSIQIVLDVHRDAIEGENGEKVKYTSNIDGKDAASVMLVVGSSISGLTHENWKTNMNFAVTLQEHTQMLYSGLCRPINFRSQRFNQQLAPGSVIVEVGTNGNTLDEALLGAKYFAQSLAQFIQNAKAQ